MAKHRNRNDFFARCCLAYRRVTGEDGVYVCPLCLQRFREPNALTLEHAPPASLGGRAVCLTCLGCNSRAGYSIDAAVHEENVLAKFLSRNAGPVRAVLDAGGNKLAVNVERTESGTNIQVVEKANNPLVVARAIEYCRNADNDTTFQLTHTARNTRRSAEIGLLKSAYIAAFAKFGYRYILRHALDVVRRQIEQPIGTDIEHIRARISETLDPKHALLLFREPTECLGVKIGQSLILLPWLQDNGVDHWEWQQQAAITPSFIGRAKMLPWPKRPEMILDLGVENRVDLVSLCSQNQVESMSMGVRGFTQRVLPDFPDIRK